MEDSFKFAYKDESALGLKGTKHFGVFRKGKGRFDGVGRQILPDNTIYEGRLQEGMRNGYGRLILPTGEHFWGYHVDDKMHGYNAKYDRDGVLVSEDFYVKGETPDQIAAKNTPKPKFDERFKFNFDRVRKMYGGLN